MMGEEFHDKIVVHHELMVVSFYSEVLGIDEQNIKRTRFDSSKALEYLFWNLAQNGETCFLGVLLIWVM